jgi:hypothetical protein
MEPPFVSDDLWLLGREEARALVIERARDVFAADGYDAHTRAMSMLRAAVEILDRLETAQ